MKVSWVFWGFALVAGYFLVTEHQAHVVQALPFLLVLACPLMHLFHGHRGHEHKQSGDAKAQPDKKHSGGCH